MEQQGSGIATLADSALAFLAFEPSRLLEPGIIAALILQLFLFACSAFFSGSETALFSLSRLDLQKLRRDKHPRSDTLHALLDHPRRLIVSILCGNELVNIAATANLAGILVQLYGPERAGWINVLVMFPLLLLFGEVTPKTIAVGNPVKVSANIVAWPLSLWTRLITPIRRVVRIAADRITTWIVGPERGRENILRVDEFRTLLADVAEEGVLDATERVLIDNLLEAGETEIVEIMTPRTKIKFLKDNMSVAEIVARFREIKHPRVPVCHDQPDNLVGFVHAEDIVRLIFDKVDLETVELESIIHPPVVTPPTKYVDEMFDFFQSHRARAAAVINEFGGVEGFITMRDVVNFIFGEISEGVVGQHLYEERDGNAFEVPGDMKLTDFDDLTNFGIEDPRMTTIGGVVFRYLDRLPKVGDMVELDGCVATVLAMDGHRLARVRVVEGGLEDVLATTPDVEEEAEAEKTETDAETTREALDDTSSTEPRQTTDPETVDSEPVEAGAESSADDVPTEEIADKTSTPAKPEERGEAEPPVEEPRSEASDEALSAEPGKQAEIVRLSDVKSKKKSSDADAEDKDQEGSRASSEKGG